MFAPVLRKHAFDFSVQKQNIVFRSGIRLERRSPLRHVGNRENRQIAFRDANLLRRAIYHLDPERTEQAQYAAGLRRPRRVVVSRYHHDCGVRKHRHEPRELLECVQYRRIGRADGVEHVARYEHEIRTQLDHLVDDALHRARDIRLTLVDASGGLPLILPEAEMYVRDVNEFHRARITLIHCVIFVRTSIGARSASPCFDGFVVIDDRTMMVLLESVIHPSRRSI